MVHIRRYVLDGDPPDQPYLLAVLSAKGAGYFISSFVIPCRMTYRKVFARVVSTTDSLSSPGLWNRITNTAACLMTPKQGMSAHIWILAARLGPTLVREVLGTVLVSLDILEILPIAPSELWVGSYPHVLIPSTGNQKPLRCSRSVTGHKVVWIARNGSAGTDSQIGPLVITLPTSVEVNLRKPIACT
jgi:hypothetical protein